MILSVLYTLIIPGMSNMSGLILVTGEDATGRDVSFRTAVIWSERNGVCDRLVGRQEPLD